MTAKAKAVVMEGHEPKAVGAFRNGKYKETDSLLELLAEHSSTDPMPLAALPVVEGPQVVEGIFQLSQRSRDPQGPQDPTPPRILLIASLLLLRDVFMGEWAVSLSTF